MRHTIRIAIGLALATGLIFAAVQSTRGAAPTGAAKTCSVTATPKATPTDPSQATASLPSATYVASVIGVTPSVLQQELAAGKTILQIAGAKYPSASDLATALLVNVKMKLDRAVAQGGMTREQETAIYNQMHDAYARLVVTPHPTLAPDYGASGSKSGVSSAAPEPTPGTAAHGMPALGQIVLPDPTYVASVVGVTPTVLQRDLAAGKTVLQIAGGKYASANDLATALLANLKMKLDFGVSHGGLTRAQATAIYNQMHTAYARLVVTPHPPMASDPGMQTGCKGPSGSVRPGTSTAALHGEGRVKRP